MAAPGKVIWQERFTTPGADALMDALDRQSASLLGTARTKIQKMDGIEESVEWLGVPWRWTLSYSTGDLDTAFAYLIPEPERPQLALPLPIDILEAVTTGRQSRTVRDGILHAKVVSGVAWAEWELTSAGMVDDLMRLARKKHEALVGA